MRFGVDTGGTFTDLVIEDSGGELTSAKAPTTPADPAAGVLDVLAVAARRRGRSLRELLSAGELLIYGTTHAINAIVTGPTARTALLVTEGHEDVLTLAEGGRLDPYDYGQARPRPYIPRRLTFGVRERVYADGRVLAELDEDQVRATIARLRDEDVEAVAVCLLWSVVNPAHEQRVGELLAEGLPGVPVTLSHELNPTLREYRRASSAAIDASLRPLMATHLGTLEERLRDAGFAGRLMVVTSGGGMLDAAAVSAAPIHSINSGPAMAPVAARHYAQRDAGAATAIVGDAGGTTFDVSLIRGGRIGRTREKWIGRPYVGFMTGFHSVDMTSVGAGGGSIASVDAGGLLHVGPASAGADPGPACFGRGGTAATVTDACLVLGRLDPAYFLGGAMTLDAAAAFAAVEEQVAGPLGMDVDAAAAAVVNVVTEHMAMAIEEITINQGIDPATATYVAGGGAAGLNAVAIARRLGCRTVVVPETVATLSAAGALMSDVTADFSTVLTTGSDAFDADAVNAALAGLRERAQAFIDRAGGAAGSGRIEFGFEARYASQIWEIEVPLAEGRVDGPEAVAELRAAFEGLHRELYGFADPASDLTFTQWNARATCRARDGGLGRAATVEAEPARSRSVHVPGVGRSDVPVHRAGALAVGQAVDGPAIIESALTTIVVDPGATARRTVEGSVVVEVVR